MHIIYLRKESTSAGPAWVLLVVCRNEWASMIDIDTSDFAINSSFLRIKLAVCDWKLTTKTQHATYVTACLILNLDNTAGQGNSSGVMHQHGTVLSQREILPRFHGTIARAIAHI